MKYPTLTEMQVSRDWIDAFGGYNHNLRISNAEFYEMKNMTGDDYPTLSPRKRRGIKGKTSENNYQGLISKNNLCWVADNSFYINGTKVSNFELSNTPKQMVSMGAYVIILPDKKYININDFNNDKGSIEVIYTSEGKSNPTVSFEMSFSDASSYAPALIQAEEPSAEKVAEILATNKIPVWVDISKETHVLKIYSETTETWTQVSATYTKISALDIGVGFAIGDGVEISGITAEGATAFNGYYTITSKGDNYIVVPGLIAQAVSQSDPITVKRSMPDLDYIVESNNRLWGCKYYGEYKDGLPTKAINTIFACKLGDFKNWYSFSGTAMDSYNVTVGTDGQFTGAATHLGYPIFFKENCMHKIYGNYPSNYQVQTTVCKGVQLGSGKSIATVNNVLYYKSQSGVCAYDGSLPVEISGALGDISYSDAVAGAVGNKYYICMKNNVPKDASDEHHLLVYDTSKGFWHKEDNVEVGAFEYSQGDLYFINKDTNQIMSVGGGGEIKDPNPVDWEVVTGTLGTDSPDKKYISKIDVRMLLNVGSRVTFYAEYDSSGEWEHLFNMDGRSLKSFSVPVRPKRCDHMRLKIVGKGEAKIYSICKSIEWGSDK